MTGEDLGRLRTRRLTGAEPSDLGNNTTRGLVAEYLVAKALGIPTAQARDDWGSFDLAWGALRIEVKSSAYVQSWAQRRLSTIQFVVSKRLGWDPETTEMETEARRPAHAYVLALLAHRDKSTIDPLSKHTPGTRTRPDSTASPPRLSPSPEWCTVSQAFLCQQLRRHQARTPPPD